MATRRVLNQDDLTIDDIIEMGPDAVNDRLPKTLLLAMSRKYVQVESNKRRRRFAMAAERRAYGMIGHSLAPDQLDSVILAASLEAARAATMTWRPLLDIPFLVPTHDRETTWGRATTDEHRERAEWLENLAVGNVRTASHHRKAIYDIEDNHVRNLIEVVATVGE